MADLRARYLEDYAGGLLNIARQELSSTGEVLAQDGFLDDTTLFVEDGRGVKSGLRLGAALAECVDPSTDSGVLNFRTAERTYAKIRDLKVFSTAVASAQAALSESVAGSIGNLENAFELLESDFQSGQNQFSLFSDETTSSLNVINSSLSKLTTDLSETQANLASLNSDLNAVKETVNKKGLETLEKSISKTSPDLNNNGFSDLDLVMSRYYALLYVTTNVPAWVTIYTSSAIRDSDNRSSVTAINGVVADIVTTSGNLIKQLAPALIGYSNTSTVYIRVRNKSGVNSKVSAEVKYINL